MSDKQKYCYESVQAIIEEINEKKLLPHGRQISPRVAELVHALLKVSVPKQ